MTRMIPFSIFAGPHSAGLNIGDYFHQDIPLQKLTLFYPYFFKLYRKVILFFPHHIIDITYYTNPILNISEHCFNAILLLL